MLRHDTDKRARSYPLRSEGRYSSSSPLIRLSPTRKHLSPLGVSLKSEFPFKCFKPACAAALKRIFKLNDSNKDSVLDASELNEFQVSCCRQTAFTYVEISLGQMFRHASTICRTTGSYKQSRSRKRRRCARWCSHGRGVSASEHDFHVEGTARNDMENTFAARVC